MLQLSPDGVDGYSPAPYWNNEDEY